MLETIKNEMKDELFSYLNYLISNELYPYMYQVRGKYKAEELHRKIENEFDRIVEKETSSEEIDNSSVRICGLIDDDLSSFILDHAKGNIYLLDFKVFSCLVSDKMKKILNKYKNYRQNVAIEC